MTTLYDLVDKDELDRLMSEGRINKQVHPKLPLSIFNYSAKAQFANEWLNAERVCRGLIVEDGTNKVIARGPEKFFNYGQTGAPETTLDTKVQVTYKEDGSLGIGWVYREQYGIATRGSFTSDQSVHATEKITDKMKEIISMNSRRGRTDIYEIVYPGNRIVLDYGDRDELIDLGTVKNSSGLIVDRYAKNVYMNGGDWFDQLKGMSLKEALKLPIPSDEEGYVLDILDSDGRTVTGHVKLKGEDYKLLHGLLTRTNARRIWVQLAARGCHHWINEPEEWANKLGHDPKDFERVDVEKDIVDTFLKNVPDEFYNWVTRQIDSINDRVSDLVIQSILLAGNLSMVDDKRTRYETVKDHPMCKEILNYVESRDESILILKAWKLAKPAGDDTPFKTQGDED